MRKAVAISAALHVSLLLYAVAAIPSARDLESTPMIEVPIDLVTPDEFTQLKAGIKETQEEKPLARKPKDQSSGKSGKEPVKQAAAAPMALPESATAEKEPEPKAESKPKEKAEKRAAEKQEDAEPKKAKDKENRPKKAEAKRIKPTLEEPTPEEPQAEKARDAFDPDRIAALLNKIPDAAEQPRVEDSWEPVVKETDALGQSTGTEPTMTANELDFLRQRISQCWSPPVGGIGADAILVRLRLQLNVDGTLAGMPSVMNSEPSPFFRPAADSAVRAVAQCQPYPLPVEKYALWRDIILNFDPSDMFGG